MAGKSKSSKLKFDQAVDSLSRGGRADIEQLREIANASVIELLNSGLTLQQAETVLRMATIEIARVVEEMRMIPKSPAVEVKLKKGKK
jgi:hypothetical protein